jgi:uncharacterized protein (DUF488 family)
MLLNMANRPMSTLYTIGYEGTDIARFIHLLVTTGVEVLADVRAVPLSRKRGFSKKALAERLSQAGIRYVHFKDLGDPKPGREAARAGKYDKFRRLYTGHLATTAAASALRDLARLADANTICLMCFERDPAVCHRSMVTDRLSRNRRVLHLYVEPDVSSALIARSSARQSIAAA